MKKFLSILLLGLFFITPSQADDISDFEIEGISIMDSALNYFSEVEIKDNSSFDAFDYLNKGKIFYYAEFYKKPSFKKYEAVQIILKFNDKNYQIYGVNAGLFIEDVNECRKKLDEGTKELSEVFKNAEKVDQPFIKLKADKSGKSTYGGVAFFMKSGSISLKCYDWSEEKGNLDQLRIGLFNKEIYDWFAYEAY